MKHHGFTDIQTKRIMDLVSRLHKDNTSLSANRKIEGISFFTDDNYNFMCSYCELNFSDGKFHSELNYVLIRPTGEVIDGIEYYGSDILADKQCSRMFKITLN